MSGKYTAATVFGLILFKISITFGIVNGAVVSTKEPFERILQKSTVWIQSNTGYCSGTLLDREQIITAAHCVYDKTSLQVYLNQKWVKVTSYAHHRRYQKDPLMYDVGLISLKAGVLPSMYERFPLHKEDPFVQAGTEIIVAGFGTDIDRSSSIGVGVLRYKKLKVRFSDNKDGKVYLLDQSDGGLCTGDSGGPAIAIQNGKIYLLGINSSTSIKTCRKHAFIQDMNEFKAREMVWRFLE